MLLKFKFIRVIIIFEIWKKNINILFALSATKMHILLSLIKNW